MSIETATEQDFKNAKRAARDKWYQRNGRWRANGKKRRSIQILDGVLARPFHSLENSWELILRTWVPPPARIFDVTAGPRYMWKNLLEPSHRLDGASREYELIFGDIDPNANDVIRFDVTKQTDWFLAAYPKSFDAVVVDPPYRRNVKGGRYDIENFKGSQDFNLALFFTNLNEGARRVLNPNGRLIVKIGDSRVNGQFEPWDFMATQILTHFNLEDRVIRRPFYQRRIAINRKDRATLTHETFLLYSLKPVEPSAQRSPP